MQEYTRQLETLIIDVLLPVYLEHARRTGDTEAYRKINSELLAAMKAKKKVPRLLMKDSYG